ncbi:hypothetical protein L195_g040889, partial [Trifolium pratense]
RGDGVTRWLKFGFGTSDRHQSYLQLIFNCWRRYGRRWLELISLGVADVGSCKLETSGSYSVKSTYLILTSSGVVIETNPLWLGCGNLGRLLKSYCLLLATYFG